MKAPSRWRRHSPDGLDVSLREYADANGLWFGCVPHGWLVATDARCASIVDREFKCENLGDPGWIGLQASEVAPLELGYWRTRVAGAQQAGMPMLGNLLLQDSRDDLPAWMNVDTRSFVARAAARRHWAW